MRFELYIAVRYLRAKRRDLAVGAVTMVSLLGMAVGSASLIIALAITNGTKRYMQDQLLSASSHIKLTSTKPDGIENWSSLLDRLISLPHVRAAAPELSEQVLVSRGPRASGALAVGIIPMYERQVNKLLDNVRLGSYMPLSAQAVNYPGKEAIPPVVLGKDLADVIGADIGDAIEIVTPKGTLTPWGLVPRFRKFKVVGIFDSGVFQYDASYALLRLSDAQSLLVRGSAISSIKMQVDEIDRADQVSVNVQRLAGNDFVSKTWTQENRELFVALKEEQVVTIMVILLIIFVAAMNILITLSLIVMQKVRDIAILSGLGVTPRQIIVIFISQGLLLSLAGTILGLVIGYSIIWLGGRYRFPLRSDLYGIDYLPFAPVLWHGAVVIAVSLTSSFCATIYPSLSAARINPAESLRNY